ncbi:hypothetical protein CDEST_11686 [Colletotrichum destructivum]|uniref:Uncharacterized protein n=1 Tax=Colletotrichum destructivum TaxID=34406 RepID=A0AAX4IUC4_9PEZI|nr:hypothetical protein CDEST_11686 [Colletotrichum destructivum]
MNSNHHPKPPSTPSGSGGLVLPYFPQALAQGNSGGEGVDEGGGGGGREDEAKEEEEDEEEKIAVGSLVYWDEGGNLQIDDDDGALAYSLANFEPSPNVAVTAAPVSAFGPYISSLSYVSASNFGLAHAPSPGLIFGPVAALNPASAFNLTVNSIPALPSAPALTFARAPALGTPSPCAPTQALVAATALPWTSPPAVTAQPPVGPLGFWAMRNTLVGPNWQGPQGQLPQWHPDNLRAQRSVGDGPKDRDGLRYCAKCNTWLFHPAFFERDDRSRGRDTRTCNRCAWRLWQGQNRHSPRDEWLRAVQPVMMQLKSGEPGYGR